MGRQETFMVLELQIGALAQMGGVVRYRPEFSSVREFDRPCGRTG